MMNVSYATALRMRRKTLLSAGALMIVGVAVYVKYGLFSELNMPLRFAVNIYEKKYAGPVEDQNIPMVRYRKYTATTTVPVQIPDDWVQLSAASGKFSVWVPPSWEHESMQGTDSLIGELRGGGLVIRYDYGSYSGGIDSSETDELYIFSPELIDGRTGIIAAPKDANGSMCIGFQATKFVSLSADGLSLSAKIESPDDAELVYKIFRGVTFAE